MAHPFSNGLSAAETERLALLAEECGEVLQAIGKVLRHGYASCHPDGGSDNRKVLEQEIGDLKAALALLTGCGDVEELWAEARAQGKLRSVRTWLHHPHDGMTWPDE